MRFFHSFLRFFFIYFTITGVKKIYVIPTSLLYKSSVYRRSTVIHVSGEMYNFVYFFSSLAAYCDRLEIPHTCTCTPVYCNALTFFTFVFHLLPKPTFGYFFVIHLSQFWNISTHFNSRCLKTSTATACFDALWKNMENNNYHVVTLVHLMWLVVSSCLFSSLYMNQIIPFTLSCVTWKITAKQKMWCY